jgi:FMN phosphatase YigB (HAD superfamily)
MEKTKLAVFDFDGTLMDTPLPVDGRKIYKEKTGQEWPYSGWWGQPLSLSDEIFDIQTIKDVVSDYKKEKSDPNTMVVMLTGRITKLSKYVKELLDKHNLTFDEYHYNNGGSTDFVKMRIMENILDSNKSIRELELWDDREEHIPTFQSWGDKLVEGGFIDKFNINVVPTGRH